MIKSFRSGEAKKIFNYQSSSQFPDIQRIILRKLLMIDAASNINDLRVPPANHLEKLKGNRKNQYSIRINNQYRLCFSWLYNDAYDLKIIDYH